MVTCDICGQSGDSDGFFILKLRVMERVETDDDHGIEDQFIDVCSLECGEKFNTAFTQFMKNARGGAKP